MVQTKPQILVEIVAEEARPGDVPVQLRELTQFLADIERLYEVGLPPAPQVLDYKLIITWPPPEAGRAADRLLVRRVVYGSPLTLVGYVELTAASIMAVWVLVQILEKVIKIQLEREALRLEMEKGRLELMKLRKELELPPFPEMSEPDLRALISKSRDPAFAMRAVAGLRGAAFRITDMAVRIADRL